MNSHQIKVQSWPKSSGCGWLVIACLFGLITLGVAGLGGFGIFHTTSNIALFEKGIANSTRELMESKPGQRNRSELTESIRHLKGDIIEAEDHRTIAIGITAGSLCPGFFTLMFLMMAVIFYLKSGNEKAKSPSENNFPTSPESEEERG